NRPIPSGRISRGTAGVLGRLLLVAGIVTSCVTGWVAGSGMPVCVAAALCSAIYLYDHLHKTLSAAPLLMGLCGVVNVLLGMSLVSANAELPTQLPWTIPQMAIAAGIGVYVVGVTILARSESRESERGQLAAGIAVMGAGIAALAHGAVQVGNQS